jgi:hypothetical protein
VSRQVRNHFHLFTNNRQQSAHDNYGIPDTLTTVGATEDHIFREAIRRFDQENAADPNTHEFEGKSVPYELFYSHRLSEWVERLSPNASAALRLAARCQHICRWVIPRGSYPETRAGYLKWRADLKKFHAQKSGEILAEVGYSAAIISKVQELNLKTQLGRDPEVQVLEDALCLVTLQYQLTDLIRKTEREKMYGILRKTWKKMSPLGHEMALSLFYSPEERSIIEQALAANGEKQE